MKKDKEKQINANVPMIVPIVLLVMVVGLAIALMTQGPTKVFNIISNADNYESSNGKITFQSDSYTCTEGETFETMIEATAPKNKNEVATVRSYGTSDTSVAIIDDEVTEQVKCINCRVVRVVCKKAGRILLHAESSLGAKGSAELTVKQREGTIAYDKTNYSCNAGETFETMIRTTNGLAIKSYKSSDEKIATVDTKTKLVVNCIDCLMVRVVCHKKGNAKLYATASNGATTSSSLEVKEQIGTISFSENSYTCNAGESFETMITAKGGPVGTYVKSYKSSNTNIATIDDNTSVQVKCINCRVVRVVCHKKGSVTLSATSSSGATTSVSLNVKENIGSISFAKSSYTCDAGESFETMITAKGGPVNNHVKSYGTSNGAIATIDDKTDYQVNCINCRMVRVVCHKKGSVTLKAESSTGAKTTASLTVKEDVGTIEFAKSSYTCNAGESFETLVSAKGSLNARVGSVVSSDKNIATVDYNTSVQVNCINCRMVRVVCHKPGNVSLKATSTTGATTSVNLKVENNVGTIEFAKSSYTCKAGETFETLITAKGGPLGTYVKSYGTSNNNVATIDDNTSVQVSCINCRMVRVICKKAGSVILNATSSSGATTTSSLTVEKDIGTVYFSKPSYSCTAGQSFETVITAVSGDLSARVSGYSSSNTDIATVDDNVSAVPSCINCKAIRVNCKKKGNVTLKATSTTGAKGQADLTVK